MGNILRLNRVRVISRLEISPCERKPERSKNRETDPQEEAVNLRQRSERVDTHHNQDGMG